MREIVINGNMYIQGTSMYVVNNSPYAAYQCIEGVFSYYERREHITMGRVISDIVSKLREVFPPLSMENIVDDLESSIEELGINILYSDMTDLEKDGKSVSGFARVSKESGRPEIVINGKESYYRQRFTMAHELGHIIMHWQWLPGKEIDPKLAEISYRSERGYSQLEKRREVQANEFAAELLLPQKEVELAVLAFKGFGPSNDLRRSMIANSLSNSYKVSVPMATIQLGKLNS